MLIMITTAIIPVPEFAMSMGALIFCVNTEGNWQYGSAWGSVASAKRSITKKVNICGANRENYVVTTPAEVSNLFNINIITY